MESVSRLEGPDRTAVKRAAFDYLTGPARPGHRLHRLVHAEDHRFWSLRVNRDLRIILHLERDEVVLCLERYREWLDRRTDWFVPPATPAAATATAEDEPVAVPPPSPPLQPAAPRRSTPALRPAARDRTPAPKPQPPPAGILSIDDADEDLDGILSELDRK